MSQVNDNYWRSTISNYYTCRTFLVCETAVVSIYTRNHMFKREIWDKFTKFTLLRFWNLLSETREISKFQKILEVNFPQISRIKMWFLVNHMGQALKEHTRNKKHKKQSTNISKFNKHNSIASTLQLLLWLFLIITIMIINN